MKPITTLAVPTDVNFPARLTIRIFQHDTHSKFYAQLHSLPRNLPTPIPGWQFYAQLAQGLSFSTPLTASTVADAKAQGKMLVQILHELFGKPPVFHMPAPEPAEPAWLRDLVRPANERNQT
jgi:hypothetical protein